MTSVRKSLLFQGHRTIVVCIKIPTRSPVSLENFMSSRTAFSFASKKSYSKIKSLRIPISRVQIKLMGWTVITLTSKDGSAITFKLTSHNNGLMTSLDDISVNLDVLKGTSPFSTRNRAFAVSNQGMRLGEWIQHLCSIFQCENYEVRFTIGMPQLDIQSLRSSLPKLRATNLKMLDLRSYSNLRFDDLLLFNVERLYITSAQITLRDLNRFFKLWKKGSNPKLKQFFIIVITEIKPDWNVFLKGLQGEGAEETEVGEKSFMIRNSVGKAPEVSKDVKNSSQPNFAI
ncbi:unnamed protein product [Caenorhabditis nigoni]